MNWLIHQSLELRGIETRKIVIWGAIAFIKITAVAYLFFDRLVMVSVLFPYIFIELAEKAKEDKKNKKRKLLLQFKDAMTAVTFSLNAGYSIENAFKEAVKELVLLYGVNGVIVKEFNNILRRVDNNENIEKVFADFAQKSEVEEIIYFSQVFYYAKRSGGDLIKIIRSSVGTIREKVEVDEQIQTIISGKKMEQQVMEIMPFAIIAYMRITAEEFIRPIYSNSIGVIMMCVCLVVYVIANRIGKRIVDIDV